ncbi:hypothetical protein KI688_003229 [Linnemannia hyalina]|uniref:Uncharacterized protein n=1 Tax=Linnemannia hyalina TaxID=64524 RepID=A0A9P7XMI8_9FUNG|nr:hypothetical protein KI688_003229 [Linnemannia hyalina]
MLMLGNISSSHVSAVASAPDADSEATEGDLKTPRHKRSPRKVTILEVEFSAESGSDYVDSKPSSGRSSLNSIDFLPIDHLVGPGTTSSRITTNNRLVIDHVDVSQALLDARRSLIKKQSELKDISGLLTLNFIFDAAFLKKHVPKDGQASLLSVSIPTVPDEEKKLLFDCSEFVASHSFLDSKKHVRNRILLRHYTEKSNLRQQCTSYPMPSSSWLVQNEVTYTQAIVKGVIIEYDEFAVVIADIKKPGAMDDDIQGDQWRLPCMQNLMLDRMPSAGVTDPKVVGFLLRVGNRT